jgi:microcystin-dependent protein
MARGQVLQINDENSALYSLLQTNYGGNGETTFALPDLRGAEPNGAGPAAPNYAICTQGLFPH